MKGFFQVSSMNDSGIMRRIPSNPIPGQMAFNHSSNKIEVFDGQNWSPIMDIDQDPSLLDQILELIDVANKEQLHEALSSIDKIKYVLEKTFLQKC